MKEDKWRVLIIPQAETLLQETLLWTSGYEKNKEQELLLFIRESTLSVWENVVSFSYLNEQSKGEIISKLDYKLFCLNSQLNLALEANQMAPGMCNYFSKKYTCLRNSIGAFQQVRAVLSN